MHKKPTYGIVKNRIIVPYYYDENLTGSLYVDLLQSSLIPDLIQFSGYSVFVFLFCSS